MVLVSGSPYSRSPQTPQGYFLPSSSTCAERTLRQAVVRFDRSADQRLDRFGDRAVEELAGAVHQGGAAGEEQMPASGGVFCHLIDQRGIDHLQTGRDDQRQIGWPFLAWA